MMMMMIKVQHLMLWSLQTASGVRAPHTAAIHSHVCIPTELRNPTPAGHRGGWWEAAWGCVRLREAGCPVREGCSVQRHSWQDKPLSEEAAAEKQSRNTVLQSKSTAKVWK